MKKVEMIAYIKQVHEYMADMILRAGCKPFFIAEDMEDIHNDWIKAGYKYIKDLYEKTYQEVKKIWVLLPRELWDRYFAWGDFEEHRECKLLQDALENFKRSARIGKRPDLFKKGKVDAERKRKAKGSKQKAKGGGESVVRSSQVSQQVGHSV